MERSSIITIRIEQHLFGLLREAYAAAATEAPLDPVVLEQVRAALTDAAAAALPGLPVVVKLGDAGDLVVLRACRQVGSDCSPSITEDVWVEINALLAQAVPVWFRARQPPPGQLGGRSDVQASSTSIISRISSSAARSCLGAYRNKVVRPPVSEPL